MRHPDEIRCYSRLVVDGIEALCILLKRFAYASRYSDMIPRFGRHLPQHSIITNHIMDHIYQEHGHRLTNFDQRLLSRVNLASYAAVIYQAGASLENC